MLQSVGTGLRRKSLPNTSRNLSMKMIKTLPWVLLLHLISGFAWTSVPPSPVHWKMEAQSESKSGRKIRASVSGTIEPGWHLYALDQERNGPIPTSISIPNGEAFVLAAAVQQTEPLMKWDHAVNVPVRYFERQVRFLVPLRAIAKHLDKSRPLKLKIAYQACNDRLCLPPTAVELTASISGLL